MFYSDLLFWATFIEKRMFGMLSEDAFKGGGPSRYGLRPRAAATLCGIDGSLVGYPLFLQSSCPAPLSDSG